MLMKNSSDTTGNRTRDLPARSTVPQPTVPPRTPKRMLTRFVISCAGTAFKTTLLKDKRRKGREDEVQEVSNYLVTLTKSVDTVN